MTRLQSEQSRLALEQCLALVNKNIESLERIAKEAQSQGNDRRYWLTKKALALCKMDANAYKVEIKNLEQLPE